MTGGPVDRRPTVDEIDTMCQQAKAFVQADGGNAYAFGVFDALRFVLAVPPSGDGSGIGPVTAADLVRAMALGQ